MDVIIESEPDDGHKSADSFFMISFNNCLKNFVGAISIMLKECENFLVHCAKTTKYVSRYF